MSPHQQHLLFGGNVDARMIGLFSSFCTIGYFCRYSAHTVVNNSVIPSPVLAETFIVGNKRIFLLL